MLAPLAAAPAGRYAIERELGAGGMARVCLAGKQQASAQPKAPGCT